MAAGDFWAILISWASTDTFSATHTSRLYHPGAALAVSVRQRRKPWIECTSMIRKSAHFTEYFVFSLFLMRGLRGKDRWLATTLGDLGAGDRGGIFGAGRISSVVCAEPDGASPWDSLLDTTGAAIAQVVLWLWIRFHAKDLIKQ